MTKAATVTNHQANPTPDFMHAFLGRGHNGTQKIVLLAPYHADFESVTCSLHRNGNEIASRTSTFKDKEVRNFVFEFETLVDGDTYTYKFSANGKDLDLGGGLLPSDLYFTYWKALTDSSEAILVSCNGVEEFKKKSEKWAMWRRLEKTVAAMHNKPKLLILGGDQYYQDETENEFIGQLGGQVTPELRLKVKSAAIRRAFEQTSDLAYRRLLAQIPSVAMLDDHDITDGAGGRFLTDLKFEQKYLNYSNPLIELFEAFQTSRNPAPVISKPGSAYSFVLDLGKVALVALDMRTEKNSACKILMGEEHKNALIAALKALPHKNVMILSPVVPARSSRELEGLLTAIAKLFKLPSVQTFAGRINPKLGDLVTYIAECEDDMEDSLTSECGLPFFTELLKAMSSKAATGTAYTMLTGDIHTGGSVEMKIEYNGIEFDLPVLVSSPIGYYAMPKIAEGILKESTTISLKHDGVSISAVPNQFYTNRNFMIFNPSKLQSDKQNAARIYQEEVSGYKKVALNSWVPDHDEPVSLMTGPEQKAVTQEAEQTI